MSASVGVSLDLWERYLASSLVEARVRASFWLWAQHDYLKAHSRLPGSDRTRRLRKKRRTRVWKYYLRGQS